MIARTTRRALALVAVAAMLGGCGSDMKQRADLLEQENNDLRSRAEQLEGALTDAESRRTAAEDEARAARAEAERLRTTSRAPATTPTGFEGMSGVTTSMRNGEIVVGVAGDVLFDSGKATLRNDAKRTLDGIAQVLNSQYNSRQIRIAGHTDSDPIRKSGWRNNGQLSAERALAVEEYLAGKGVEGRRMYAAAFGAKQPKGSKKDSRRVEIVILSAAPTY